MTPAETVSAIRASVIQDAKQTVTNEVRAQVLKNEIEKLKRQIRQQMEEDFRKTTRDRLLQCMWRCTVRFITRRLNHDSVINQHALRDA